MGDCRILSEYVYSVFTGVYNGDRKLSGKSSDFDEVGKALSTFHLQMWRWRRVMWRLWRELVRQHRVQRRHFLSQNSTLVLLVSDGDSVR